MSESVPLAGAVDRWILVVDDDAALRQVIGEILEDEGYVVGTASSGNEALRVLRDRPPPAAILLDLMMQDGDGFSFRNEQRADPVLAEIPVIVMTASGRPEARILSMQADGHVSKPFEVCDLLTTLVRVLGCPA